MKRVISLIMALALMLTMAVTAFASETVKFSVNVVSESNTEAVVTIDYEGGPGYNALDMTVSFSSRISIVEAKKGEALKTFLSENENAISSSNIKDNTVVTAYASIDPFKATGGKDLYRISIKKSSADKLKKSDVKLTVSNCGTLKSDGDVQTLTTSVTYTFDDTVETTKPTAKSTTKPTEKSTSKTTEKSTSKTTSKNTTKKGETTTKAGETTTKLGETTTIAGETTTLTETTTEEGFAGFAEISGEDSSDGDALFADSYNEKNEEKSDSKQLDKKKIIIVGAAALCCLLVIAAVVFFIINKSKKDSFED